MKTLRTAPLAILAVLALLSGCGGTLGGSPPGIVTQPSSVSTTVGQTVTFSVVASGSNLTYQWYRDGAAITDATAASYTIADVQLRDAGDYYVSIKNDDGTLPSNTATLTVTE